MSPPRSPASSPACVDRRWENRRRPRVRLLRRACVPSFPPILLARLRPLLPDARHGRIILPSVHRRPIPSALEREMGQGSRRSSSAACLSLSHMVPGLTETLPKAASRQLLSNASSRRRRLAFGPSTLPCLVGPLCFLFLPSHGAHGP